MSTKSVLRLCLILSLPSATFLSLFAASVHSAPLNCEDWNEDTPNQVAVARIATTQPRLHFIAARNKRMPACPSLGSTCKLKAFLLPGDEVLVNVTEQGPYVCATYKTQSGVMTRGLLPRVALQVASPAEFPLNNGRASGAGTQRLRLSSSPVTTKWRSRGKQVLATATLSAANGDKLTRAN